jgi:hypothetical protein
MIFKEWLLLNENIEANFDDWLKDIIKYEKPAEATILRSLGLYVAEYPKDYSLSLGVDKDGKPILAEPVGSIVFAFSTRFKKYKDIIIKVLKSKHLENLNWLSFSIGYLAVKKFLEEDLELAIDVTKRRIDNRELPKSEIGQKGWMEIGKEAQQYVTEYLRAQQELSNRQKLKLKKSGDTLEEDESLIKLIADENDLKLYYLPKVIDKSNTEQNYKQLETNKTQIEGRKRILCKYGKGTDWCTANPSGEYDRYYAGNDIYIIHENDVPKYQFTSCLTGNPQFMDKKDNHVTDIELGVKELLEKYISKETNCYDFKIIFPDIESYKKNKDRKVSAKNIKDLIATDEFKKLPPQEAKEFIKEIDVENMTAEDTMDLIKSLPDRGADYFDDKTINTLISRFQYGYYDELDKKLSSDRLQKFLNNYKNNNYDYPKDSEDYIQGSQDSRKKTIRQILSNAHNTSNSLRILKFLTKKINFGSQESYTVFDTMMGIITKSYREGMIDKKDVVIYLFSYLARDLGKSNINQIDLNRLQQRMNIELTPENGKYKITMPEEDYKSARYLMALFLKNHSDKII